MISTALSLLLAGFTMQASDTTRASRESYTHCLQLFVNSSASAHKTLAQWQADFPHACATEEGAFRAAIIARDGSSRATRAGAEESANMEIQDARANYNDRFEMSLPPEQLAHAAPPAAPAASQPAQPTVAATNAAQTTGAAHPAQPAQPH